KSETRLHNTPSWQQQADMIETCRLATTAARFMTVFQEGLQTLAKLRTGGKQVVVVQHIHVNDGGQAGVACDLTTGGRSAVGGVGENRGTILCTAPSKPHGRPRAVEQKRGKGKPAKAQQSMVNSAAACTAALPQAPHEATSTP